MPMLNALSIDVEAFADRISPDNWRRFEPRVEKNVDTILEILAEYRTSAQQFVSAHVRPLTHNAAPR